MLSAGEAEEIIASAAGRIPSGKRILVIIPDHTRSCPLGMIARQIHTHIGSRAKKLDFLIALGTHPPLNEDQIDKLLDIEPGRRDSVLGGSRVFNHNWTDPQSLAKIGTLTASHVEKISGGKFSMSVDVTINKLVLEYDLIMVAGPVFPHEVVGFSGGEKYFFPGICGPDLLNFFHWLGAVITCPRIIGTKVTPVRKMLWAAADMIDVETCALCMVVKGHDDLAGLYFGSVRQAWDAAADLSGQLHIVRVDKPFESVLAQAPQMYDDLWVGAKCMYKMESVVADGGELIIYAPHIHEISVTHGKVIEEIGYHTLEYFLAQWDKFKGYPWGVLAHSTHVRGIGSYENGVEKPRVTVTLATGIDEQTCRKVNLGYRDPDGIDPSRWQGCEDQGRIYVPKAGEMLYKLKNPPAWQNFEP